MSKDINVNLFTDDQGARIVVLEGKAPNEAEPSDLRVSGQITSPGNYANHIKDQITPCAYVSFNRDTYQIEFINGAATTIVINISGKLELDQTLESLQINTDKAWRPKELGDKLRFLRRIAVDPGKLMELITKLKNFEYKFESSGSSKEDNTGKRELKHQQAVETVLDRFFSIKTEIFKGEAKAQIPVEIVVRLNNNQVLLSLESLELADLKEEVIESAFKREKKRFKDLGVCVIDL